MAITKEAFFRDEMVPAGQILEIMLAVRSSTLGEKERVELSNVCFDMLNLAACYAVHPRTRDLHGVQSVIRDLTGAMLGVFESMGPTRAPYLAEAFGIAHRGASMDVRRKFAGSARNLLTMVLPVIRSALYHAIDYTPSTRQDWITSMSVDATPLTKGGRMNRWRTFVRNMSWERAATLTGIREHLAKAKLLEANCFNTNVGREQVAGMWAATFNVQSVDVERKDGLKALPLGVRVTPTPDRLLQVSINFDPASVLMVSQMATVRAETKKGHVLSADFEAALAPRAFLRLTDAAGLPSAVAEGERWLADQKSAKNKTHLQALLDDFLVGQRMASIRAKLNDTFSPEDRQLLLKVLAEEKKVTAT